MVPTAQQRICVGPTGRNRQGTDSKRGRIKNTVSCVERISVLNAQFTNLPHSVCTFREAHHYALA